MFPQPGHYYGVLHMLDDSLTIFGGRDSATNEYINKVTTYNNDTNSWYSQYPDMLNKRLKPGVITYNNQVIVMGGESSPHTPQDSIEVMNYHDHLQWKQLSVHLPVPMWAIKPTISEELVNIVGYGHAGGRSNGYYQIALEDMMTPSDQPLSPSASSTLWKRLTEAQYYDTTTVPYSNPPVIIGGISHVDQGSVPTSDIFLYDSNMKSWCKIDSLTSARSSVGVALLNNHNIIVIGGISGGVGVEGAMAHSLSTVEIGTITPKQQ